MSPEKVDGFEAEIRKSKDGQQMDTVEANEKEGRKGIGRREARPEAGEPEEIWVLVTGFSR
jgi:hypothetical protein